MGNKRFFRYLSRGRKYLVILVILAVLAATVIYPFSSMLIDSFRAEGTGQISVSNYLEFFNWERTNFEEPFFNSILISLAVTLSSTILGLFLAILFVKYDFPGRDWMHSLAIIPLVLPGFLVAEAYVLLYGEYGWITRVIQAMLGLSQPPFALEGFLGVFAVETFTFMPLSFLTTSASLSRMDPSLPEMAFSSGASRVRVFFKVTLPLIIPGILAGAILIFMRSMAAFGIPLFMEYTTLTVSIWRNKVMGMPYMSTTISVILTVLSLLFFYVNNRYASSKEYSSVGKGSRRIRKIDNPWARWGVTAVVVFVLIVMLLPIPGIFLMSLTELQNWSVTELLPPYITLKNYKAVFLSGGKLFKAVRNSLSFASISALMAMVFGLAVSYFVAWRKSRGSSFVNGLATLPLAIPGTVVGIAYIIAFNKSTVFSLGFVLVGTPVIIVLSHFTRLVPYVIRSTSASFQQLDGRLEEVGLSLGASWGYVFSRVTFPLVLSGLMAGTIIAFLSSLAELNSAILLYTPSSITIPTAIYEMINSFQIGKASALGSIQIFLTFVILIIVNKTIGMKTLRL